MSEKSLKSMKDENPELQKQIGCITGFFQLFDRHRFLMGQGTGSQSQHRPTSGGSSNDTKKLNSSNMQKAMAKNPKVAKEKQQFFTESSTTSMSSSSCSSSMSSIEFNRTIQTEPPSTSQNKIPENPISKTAVEQLDAPGKQSLDFHGIVKDSINREAQGLSVKTVPKEQKKGQNHTLKYIDSPRPLQSHKSVNAGVMVANEPFHVLSKSKKTPWDSPRLSYDGRVTQDTFKSATKQKELPRLSLDSRERSMRGSNEGNKSRNLLKGPYKGYGKNSSTMINQLQELETSKRSSSVVAKLMGLETLPDGTQICDMPPVSSSCSNSKNEPMARSRTSDEYKQHQSSVSPRTSQFKSVDSMTNVTPYSRFALESTPCKQTDAYLISQLNASKGSESDTKASKSSLSVYGEIEKRLAEIEFKKSGKDLRALKQILEAMQRYKEPFDLTRDQASNSPSDNRNNSSLNESSKAQSPRIQQKDPTSVTVEMSNSIKGSKLPIVIMKPAKVTRKANNPASTEMSIHGQSGLSKYCPGNPTNGRLVDKQTAKGISSTIRNIKDPFSQPVHSADKSNNLRTSKLMQSSKVPQDRIGVNTNSGIVIVTGSPRLQKKFGLERRSPPSSPSSDSCINRRQHNRSSLELSSPSTTTRQKFSTLQERNERFSELSCHWRDFKHQVNIISPDFDSKRSLATRSDIEVIHIEQSGKINSTSIQQSGLNQNNAVEELSKEGSKAETTVTAEQPSPVSVLDAAFYREDPPSPVKKKSGISKDLGEDLSTDHDSENSEDLHPLSSTTKANFNNGSSDRDLNTQNLVKILQENDWTDGKFINFSDSKDPARKYITEILLASGLLSGSISSQIFHSPGRLINPKLFLALEQLKSNKRHFNIEDSAKKIARVIDPEQMQRKLIFDVVNQILVRKVILESSSTLWCLPNEQAGRKLKGQQLLDELCTEIDQLQPQNWNVSQTNKDENLTSLLGGDLMHHPTIWINCETPNIVLDMERLIFKDLITDVVRGEVASHPGRHRRQLSFPK